jgi:hypothetical protein
MGLMKAAFVFDPGKVVVLSLASVQRQFGSGALRSCRTKHCNQLNRGFAPTRVDRQMRNGSI